MKAKINRRESWEKQTVWALENGWRARVSFGHYGETVSQLLSPSGYLWQACNGKTGLPGFAKPWAETVVQSCGLSVVRPMFEKQWA